MSKSLKIADGLQLPIETVTQTVAILAKRRVGKSYTMRRLVEQLHHAGQQVVLCDPKGDQWGLRSAADGKAAGLPFLILGGERGDVPLEPGAGELVAKLAVEERVSAVLDLSLLRKKEVATFMADFLEGLYRLKAREVYRTPMMLVVDEADAIAPQKPMPGEERMLGAIEDIVRRGGQRGIGCVVVTQRSAVLNKNVLTQAQILIALRTIAPQDLKAMKEWIDVHGDDAERKILMESLPSLPVGDAWVWSPGWPTNDGIFSRVHVLPIETFDSGATPKPGEARREPKTIADVDLEAVKRQMAATIERAKADDPRELRKRIAELERQVKAAPAAAAPGPAKTVEVLTDADRTLLTTISTQLTAISERLVAPREFPEHRLVIAVNDALNAYNEEVRRAESADRAEFLKLVDGKRFEKIRQKVDRVAPVQVTACPMPTSPATRVAIAEVGGAVARMPQATASAREGALREMHRRMLTTLAQHPAGLTKKQILIHTGYASSGPVSTAFAELAKMGAVMPAGSRLHITPAGERLLGPYEPLPTGDALRAWLLSSGKLSTMESALLRAVSDAYPQPIRKGDVLAKTGYASSGPASSAFAKLVGLNYVRSQGPSMLVASAELFG